MIEAIQLLDASLALWLLDQPKKTVLVQRTDGKTKVVVSMFRGYFYIPIFVAPFDKVAASPAFRSTDPGTLILQLNDRVQEYAILLRTLDAAMTAFSLQMTDLKLIVNPTIMTPDTVPYMSVSDHLTRLRELVRNEGAEIETNWEKGGCPPELLDF